MVPSAPDDEPDWMEMSLKRFSSGELICGSDPEAVLRPHQAGSHDGFMVPANNYAATKKSGRSKTTNASPSGSRRLWEPVHLRRRGERLQKRSLPLRLDHDSQVICWASGMVFVGKKGTWRPGRGGIRPSPVETVVLAVEVREQANSDAAQSRFLIGGVIRWEWQRVVKAGGECTRCVYGE